MSDTAVTVAVLFAHRQSVYKSMPHCDVYDIDRDARTFQGGVPVVAHPPCRAWGHLAHFAKPRPDERALSTWAVDQVRRWGGVLEHPRASRLWAECALPLGAAIDAHGGFSLDVNQSWWGHAARKRTLLYIVGITPRELPPMPFSLMLPPKVLDSRNKAKVRGCHLPKSQREHTPLHLAQWLCTVARLCRRNAA